MSNDSWLLKNIKIVNVGDCVNAIIGGGLLGGIIGNRQRLNGA